MKVLWICFVWPEKKSSAAGFRTLDLILSLRDLGYKVEVVSPCQDNSYKDELAEQGIVARQFAANDSVFDEYLKEYNPELVFFDRFIIEEQFSWRVRQNCPQALRILDSVDLQALRRTRQNLCKDGKLTKEVQLQDFHNQDIYREIASIHRSDFTIITSDYEFELLINKFDVAKESLFLYRFSYENSQDSLSFEKRRNFVTIGNFNHAPNLDSYNILHDLVWPKIKTKLDNLSINDVELHIYGGYPKGDFCALDNKKTGFRVRGFCEDAKETLGHYKVNLAPLRFGAGIKGKVSDSWAVGTPVIATPIAAEGMHENLEFGGIVTDNWDDFAEQSVNLYMNRECWVLAQKNSLNLIEKLYNKQANKQKLHNWLSSLSEIGRALRTSNFIGAILWQQQYRSTEYFSRWIELKNSN